MGIFGFGRVSKEKKALLKVFNGRTVNHVTRRVNSENGVKDTIVGKTGRIAVTESGTLSIICGTADVFLCQFANAKCNLLLSGNGALIEGENSVIGGYDSLIVYFNRL